MKIINVKENKEYLNQTIDFLKYAWGHCVDGKIYEDCISNSINTNDDIPNWYLLIKDEEIIGCAGLISNDFVSRMDLKPFLCALYIKEEYRGNNYASLLINKIKEDTFKYGYNNLYICTDHIGFYEKHGFEYIGIGYHPWNSTSRIYRCNVNSLRENIVETIKQFIDKTMPLSSNLANVSKILYDAFNNTSWAGFYLSNDDNTMLYLSNFIGPIACSAIPYNKGVCGKAAYNKQAILVENVHEFEGHIACSSLSNSEIVVPIIKDNVVKGVIDLDSNLLNNYNQKDLLDLCEIADILKELF